MKGTPPFKQVVLQCCDDRNGAWSSGRLLCVVMICCSRGTVPRTYTFAVTITHP